MNVQGTTVRFGRVGFLRIEAYPTTEAMGQAAAQAAAKAMLALGRGGETVSAIFATGASQLATLGALTKMPGLPWSQVSGYHMDEYVGLPVSHPASFRGYLRERLTERVRMKEFFEIDGTAPDPEQVCADYEARLQAANPQLCLLGIGENGHLAFNDPGVADFNDPKSVKVALLDLMCRTQQAAEGWFRTPDDVPQHAITITIPTILKVPALIASVPGQRKAAIVRRTLEDPIDVACPATILREHQGATLYLDAESASEIDDYLSAECEEHQ